MSNVSHLYKELLSFTYHTLCVNNLVDSLNDFPKIASPLSGYDPTFQPGIMFVVAYILCVVTIVLDLKQHRLAKHAMLRSALNILLSIDGLMGLLMGVGIYLQSNLVMGFAILLSCKFFLLHFLRLSTCMYGCISSVSSALAYIRYLLSTLCISNVWVA